MNTFIQSYKHWIALSIISFLLLLVLQGIWLNKAVQIQQERKDLDLSLHIHQIAMEVNTWNRDLFHGAETNIKDSVNIDSVKRIIQHYLKEFDLPLNTHFAIYKDSISSEFISDAIAYKESLINSKIKSCISCIVSFYTAKKITQEEGESEDDFSKRLDSVSEFQYFSPVQNIAKGDKAIWLTLYAPPNVKDSVKSFLGLFLGSIALLSLLIYLFYYLLRSLNKHKKEAQAKDDFFNNMTHEFKTPLSSIRLASSVLRQNVPEKKRENYLDLIEKESKSLENQIDKILELSLLDHAKIQLEKEHINLCLLVHDIPQQISPLIEDKKAKIKINCLSEDLYFTGDTYHINKSLINLIENSLKYGPVGVEVEVEIKKTNQNIELRIRDNGPGIEKEFRNNIFERFNRGKKNNQYKGQGFGIGLSYVQFVIESHGGTINLNKNVFPGCEFIISL